LPGESPLFSIRLRRLLWIAAAVVVLIGYWLLTGIRDAREAARRSQCKGNLKQIGLALLNYREAYGCFPPAYVADDNGRPIHSWRVLILPFLDQAPLYNEYRFDEPWDGPNNRKLAGRFGRYFIGRCPSDGVGSEESAGAMTSYVAVVGPQTIWTGDSCVNTVDITDGPEQTLMVVEVANSGINWMEPRDLHVLQMAPKINPSGGQGISSRHRGGAHATTAENSVRFLFEKKITASTLRALLTRNGGEKISSDDF
jgi:hypothetical protein